MINGNVTYGDIMEIEDRLQASGVFENGLDGRPAHMDCYMTIIDYKKLDCAFKDMKNDYTAEQWRQIAGHWGSHAYLSPNQAQLAFWVKRKLEAVP